LKADAATRARLLETAERLFAERGFKAVTVRQICGAAGANVAAVNYHFRDKLGLYREVVRSAATAMRETSEAAREAGRGAGPEEQLRRYVHVFFDRALRGGRLSIHRIIAREMNEPTPALDTLVEEGVRPRVVYLSGLIAQVLGCDPRDPRVLRCVASLQSQVVAYFPNPVSARMGFPFKATPRRIQEAADHVATFSIAGIRAVRRMAPAHNRGRSMRRPRERRI
jgi:AcrR family transcriptional regulator